MGGKADAALWRRQAKPRPHGPAEPGIGILGPGPGPFVEAAEHHQIGLLQARFHLSPNEQARMGRPARPHGLPREERAVDGRIATGGEREAIAVLDQPRQEHRQGFARVPGPQGRGAGLVACQRFGGIGVRVDELCGRELTTAAKEARKRRECVFERCHERGGFVAFRLRCRRMWIGRRQGQRDAG